MQDVQSQALTTPLQRRSEHTLQRILGALESLLHERYFEDITISELASRAGVSVGVCYQRFKNKEGMLKYVYDVYGQRLERVISELARAESWQGHSAREAARVLISRLATFYHGNRALLRTIYLHLRLQPQVIEEGLLARRQSMMDDIASAMLADDRDSGGMLRRGIYTVSLVLIDLELFSDLPPAWLSEGDVEQVREEQIDYLAALIDRARGQRTE